MHWPSLVLGFFLAAPVCLVVLAALMGSSRVSREEEAHERGRQLGWRQARKLDRELSAELGQRRMDGLWKASHQ